MKERVHMLPTKGSIKKLIRKSEGTSVAFYGDWEGETKRVSANEIREMVESFGSFDEFWKNKGQYFDWKIAIEKIKERKTKAKK